jgi:hypothetical protein
MSIWYAVEEYEHMSPVGEITMCRVISKTGEIIQDCLHIDEAQAIADRMNDQANTDRLEDEPLFETSDDFNILALIEAGTIRENDSTLAIMQNISREKAHTIAKWLALATNTPAYLRHMGLGGNEDIRYTPEQVRAEAEANQRAHDTRNNKA